MRLAVALATVATLGCAVLGGGCAHPPSGGASAPPRRAAVQSGESRIERMLRSAEIEGLGMARATIALSEIPTRAVPPMLGPDEADEEAAKPAAWRQPELAFAQTQQSAWGCEAHSNEERLFCAACRIGRRRAVRVEGPVRGGAAHRTLVYELVDGVYDPNVAGIIGDVRRTRIVASELVPHLVYAFRFVDEREPGVERVSVVLPPAVDFAISRSRPMDARDDVRGSFSRATLPVRPGGSESVVARVTSAAVSAWIEQLSPGSPPPPEEDLVVGVELSSAGDEPAPQLVAYVQRVRAPGPTELSD